MKYIAIIDVGCILLWAAFIYYSPQCGAIHYQMFGIKIQLSSACKKPSSQPHLHGKMNKSNGKTFCEQNRLCNSYAEGKWIAS